MKILITTLENLRYYTYWSLDFIKKSKVRKHLNDVSFILENFSNEKAKL